MKYAHYEFDKISNHKGSQYILQYVVERQLTNIYHSHNFFEVCILLSGTVNEYFNGVERVLHEGTVTIIKPDEPHCFIAQSTGIRLICLSVEKEEALRLFEAFNINIPQNNIIFHIGNAVSAASGIIKSAMAEYNYKLFFCQILTLFLDSQGNSIPYVLENAIQQMQKPENMQLGISKIVELSGYSRSHLTRLVRQYYHCSLQELIIQLRLDAAYKEIILSNDPIEEISYKIGYASFSHFQKVFKNTFGVTPAVLRKTKATWTV